MKIFKENKLLFISSIGMLLLSFLFFIGIQYDSRLILGINPWIKPLKFSTSIFIYALTMIYILRFHEEKERKKYSQIFAATMWIEIFFIALQACRGVRSHFNQDSFFDIIVFAIMGMAILINTIYVFKLTITIFKKSSEKFAINEIRAIKYGLVIFLLGSIEGGIMSSRTGHTVGTLDGGPGIKFLNWSTIAGDLRVSHFIGLHGIQILLFIYFASKYILKIKNAESSQLVAILLKATAALFMALTIFTFLQAMSGKSLFSV